jgi:peptide/nickel transport system substrate-binding protein
MASRIRRRELLRLTAAAGSAAFLSACVTPTTTASPTPAATATPGTAGKYPLGQLEGAELITDTSKYPKTFKEAPELAELVKQGKLPPVADRIGQDPLVYKPVHEIGKYGGILHKSFIGTQDGTAFRFANGPDSLLWFDWQWKKVVPNIARGFDQSADGKTLTIQLRRGMKWSDGVPFDVDDIMFWYNDIYKNKDLVSGPSADLQINGKDVTVEKVDQYTVRFNSPEPNYLLASRMAAGAAAIGGLSATPTGTALGMLAPAHYLKKLLPKYSSQAEIDKQAAAEKYTGWTLWFYDKFNIYLNVDLPTLAPWRTTRPNNDPELVRHGAQPVQHLGRHRRQPVAVHRHDPARLRRRPERHRAEGGRRRIRLPGSHAGRRPACRARRWPGEGRLQDLTRPRAGRPRHHPQPRI